MKDSPPDTPIRDAATILLVRDAREHPAVLMGQRGASAAFMPSKMVFPGGAVDPGDAQVPHAAALDAASYARLSAHSPGTAPEALAAAAIRELWEETGLRLARPGGWDRPAPPGWADFAQGGLLPDPAPLTFFFRAITPPGRPRRFDARFFLADASRLADDPDDLSRAGDELSFLRWVAIDEALTLDLPFITRVVLTELADRLPDLSPPGWVPFFDNSGPEGRMIAL